MISSPKTVQRQKAESLLVKACGMIRHYGKAVNCFVSVIDPDFNAVEVSNDPIALFFCSVCKKYRCTQAKKSVSGEYPCYAKHIKAIHNSWRLGGLYIYLCDLGFVFWTSPFFSGEQFAGALIASGVLGITRQQAEKKIMKISNGEISLKQIKYYMNGLPERNHEEIKAMAQMMLMCADQISVKNLSTELMLNGQNEAVSKTVLHPGNISRETDNEIKLLAALRRGDGDEARNLMGELLKINKPYDSFENMQLRAIELAALLSRAAVDTAGSDKLVIQEENDQYLNKIEGAKNAEELLKILNSIIDAMAVKMFSFQDVLHYSALRKAERFIWQNYTRKISLKEIAGAAGLSAPYFSTIFREEMGIHLSRYLNRIRVAKAAAFLVETDQAITRIAMACGFADQSWFSKIFKDHTGVSPGKYRERKGIYNAPDWLNLKETSEEITA